jgi:predicted DsbA family dithiol-disulfide isomerase
MPETGWRVPSHVRARMNLPENPLKLRARSQTEYSVAVAELTALVERLRRELGIELHEREWVSSSRRAHECTEFARAQGKLEPFHASLLEAYWSQGKDLHAWEVLEEVAQKAELDFAAMRAAVEEGAFVAAVDERVSAAQALGIQAVPTFLINDRLIIEGAHRADVFRQAFQKQS